MVFQYYQVLGGCTSVVFFDFQAFEALSIYFCLQTSSILLTAEQIVFLQKVVGCSTLVHGLESDLWYQGNIYMSGIRKSEDLLGFGWQIQKPYPIGAQHAPWTSTFLRISLKECVFLLKWWFCFSTRWFKPWPLCIPKRWSLPMTLDFGSRKLTPISSELP